MQKLYLTTKCLKALKILLVFHKVVFWARWYSLSILMAFSFSSNIVLLIFLQMLISWSKFDETEMVQKLNDDLESLWRYNSYISTNLMLKQNKCIVIRFFKKCNKFDKKRKIIFESIRLYKRNKIFVIIDSNLILLKRLAFCIGPLNVKHYLFVLEIMIYYKWYVIILIVLIISLLD